MKVKRREKISKFGCIDDWKTVVENSGFHSSRKLEICDGTFGTQEAKQHNTYIVDSRIHALSMGENFVGQGKHLGITPRQASKLFLLLITFQLLADGVSCDP